MEVRNFGVLTNLRSCYDNFSYRVNPNIPNSIVGRSKKDQNTNDLHSKKVKLAIRSSCKCGWYNLLYQNLITVL